MIYIFMFVFAILLLPIGMMVADFVSNYKKRKYDKDSGKRE